MFIKKKLNRRSSAINKPLPPFEEREKVQSLSLFFTIVNRHQAGYFLKAYEEVGASMSLVLYAHSMPPVEILQLLGPDETKKDIIFTVARSEYLPKLKQIAAERFKISKVAKGIAFAIPIDSVSGIAVYKFLADHNKEARIHGEK